MKSYKVVIWKLSINRSAKKPTYLVRWSVDGEPFHESHKTQALADRFRAKLLRAADKGEPFDTVTGLPDSLRGGKAALSLLGLALRYIDARWADASAKQRDSMTDALATVLPALVKPVRGRPTAVDFRRALRSYVLPPPRRERERPEEIAAAAKWIEKASLPVAELQEITRVHELIDALTRKLDGKHAATQTYRRRRAVVFNVLEYAVELEMLPSNPLSRVRRKRGKRAVQEVDRRVVVNPRQARELLTAVTYVGGYERASGRRLRAFFGCPYYAAMRPGEALGLRLADCTLPEKGWGRIELAETRPTAGKAWTDSGEAHDRRGLKQRADGEVRIVPIPPRSCGCFKTTSRSSAPRRTAGCSQVSGATLLRRRRTRGRGSRRGPWRSLPNRSLPSWWLARMTFAMRASPSGSTQEFPPRTWPPALATP